MLGFSRAQLRTVVSEFLMGATQHEALVKLLLMIAIWHEVYFGSQQPALRMASAG
jgi:hypothetical protein